MLPQAKTIKSGRSSTSSSSSDATIQDNLTVMVKTVEQESQIQKIAEGGNQVEDWVALLKERRALAGAPNKAIMDLYARATEVLPLGTSFPPSFVSTSRAFHFHSATGTHIIYTAAPTALELVLALA